MKPLSFEPYSTTIDENTENNTPQEKVPKSDECWG